MPRSGHGAVYDPAEDRYYLLSISFDDLIRATPAAPASLERLFPSITLPDDIDSAYPDPYSAVFDPVRHRILVVVPVIYKTDLFYSYLELWAITLDGPARWERLSSRRGLSRVFEYSVVLDPSRDRVVLYGGRMSFRFGGYASTRTLAAFDLATNEGWHVLTPATGAEPLGRYGHGAVYDPASDCMRVFCGARIDGYNPAPLADVWSLSFGDSAQDSVRWHAVTITNAPPTARYDVGSMWDDARGTALMFGGTDYTGFSAGTKFDDLWELSFTGVDQGSWRQVHPGAPGTRSSPATVFDPTRRRVVIHGGRVGSSEETHGSGDGWSYAVDSTTSWRSWTHPTAAPIAQETALAFWHPKALKTYWVFWGGSGRTARTEVYTYDPARPGWTRINAFDPPNVSGQLRGIFDPPRNRIVMLATDYPGGNPRIHAFDLTSPSWTPVPTSGAVPPLHFGFETFYDAGNDRMIVLGGNQLGVIADSVWTLSLSDHQWSRPIIVGPRPPVGYSRPVLDERRSRIVTIIPVGTTWEVWALKLGTPMRWENITPAGEGPPRVNLVAIDPAGDRCIVVDNGANLERVSTWEFALAEPSGWNRLDPPGEDRVPRLTAMMFSDRIQLLSLAKESYSEGLSVWSLGFDITTPTRLSLHDVEVVPGRVRIRWQSSESIEDVLVERRREEGAWSVLGRPDADAWGVLSYEDRSVTTGSYSYRLSGVSNAEAFQTDEVTVTVPGVPNALRVEAAAPHPARKRIRLTLTFPSTEPASIEICDLSGRRVVSRAMTPSGPGSEVLDFGGNTTVRPGVYFVRVAQAGAVATGRIVVVE